MRFRTACGGFFFVPSVRIWPGLLGPARGPARLRSAPRARGAAAGGSPRHAARASSLRLSGPAGLARLLGSLSSTTVAVAAFTPLRKRAAPPPGSTRLAARTSPLRMSGPWARLGSLVSLSSFTAGAVVFAPPRLRAAPPPGPGPAPGSRPDHFASRTRRARIALTAPSAILHAALRARGRLGRRDAVDARP